ncbi:hypothetical protein [Amycolatopsis nigrescens]|uniref:hypothetical protein n=1 Tax=Amycolatopsis nigrescens TaxID=381445 RepID=UPI0003751A61|nr:hypothetical protein [Amycolatopsis nigrescens]
MSGFTRRAALGALGLTGVAMAGAPKAEATSTGPLWTELPELPPNRVDFSPHVPVHAPFWRQLGLAGMVAGQSGEYVLAAGGANFPEPALTSNRATVLGKVYWDEAFVLRRTPDGPQWIDQPLRLPTSLAYAATVRTSRGLLVLGGEGFRHGPDGAKNSPVQIFADVFFLRYQGELVTEPLPPLPRPMSYAVAGMIGSTVYIAEGGDFFALDTDRPHTGWQVLPRWPGEPRTVAVGAALGGRFFLLSGRGQRDGEWRFHRDVYSYDPVRARWQREADLPWCVTAGLAYPVDDRYLLVVGGDKDLDRWNLIQRETALAARYPPGSPEWAVHNDAITWIYDHHTGDNTEILRYDLRRRRWEVAGLFPGPPPVTTPAVTWDDELLVISGEVRPGVRTPRVLSTPARAWRP